MKQSKNRNRESPFLEPEKEEGGDLKISRKDWGKLKNGILADKIKAKGYRLNPWLLLIIGFGVPLFLILNAAISQGVAERWAVTCPKDSFNKCLNPFSSCDPLTTTWCPDENLKNLVCLENPGFCSMPLLEPGETYGHTKTFLEKNFFWIVLICLAVAYVTNHLFYNSKKQREERKNDYERKSS